jgi:transcriptional regulator with XRE-family HTH domain
MSSTEQKVVEGAIAELRTLLAEKNITQEAIGKALGISQSAVSMLLTGRSSISLPQFVKLCKISGSLPHHLFSKAESRIKESRTMTNEQEKVVFGSGTSLIVYAAATKPISAEDIHIHGISRNEIQKALDELVRVQFLEKKRGKYQQVNKDIAFVPASRINSSKAHLDVIVKSSENFDRNYSNKPWINNTFNFNHLDRYSKSQAKQIEAILWKAFEEINSITQDNLASNYSDDDHMNLWAIHIMFIPPLDSSK